MVMAGGTGGHVFPALAVAEELRTRGLEVFWFGSRGGFETRVVPERGLAIETISIRGLRGNGLLGWLLAPWRISQALLQSLRILRRQRPMLVLGMGGFVTGPGGVMARLLGIPLVIHEQNAIAGMTNRWLSRIANRVLEAFPGSFGDLNAVQLTGNPVRADIVALPGTIHDQPDHGGPPRMLILGGSLGAQALNETVPVALALLPAEQRPQLRHQAGRGKLESTQECYRQLGVEAEVVPFVADMAAAYRWADLVICRAGALTIAELAVAGVASILVPYPYAVDDHQTRNAAYLVDGGAALLQPQSQLNPERLAAQLQSLLHEPVRLRRMAQAARRLGLPDATTRVADICQEVIA